MSGQAKRVRDRVHVWLGRFSNERALDLYLEETYGDDDGPISAFAADMGTGFYDHDFVESSFREATSDAAALLEGHSYAESFAARVVEAWSRLPAAGEPMNVPILAFEAAGVKAPRSAEARGRVLHYVGAFDFER